MIHLSPKFLKSPLFLRSCKAVKIEVSFFCHLFQRLVSILDYVLPVVLFVFFPLFLNVCTWEEVCDTLGYLLLLCNMLFCSRIVWFFFKCIKSKVDRTLLLRDLGSTGHLTTQTEINGW